MVDRWQGLIDEFNVSCKERKLEAMTLRSHGFITELEYFRICGDIDLYYGPFIDSCRKAKAEHYAKVEGI